jgi:hypothetical protein
MSKRGGLFLQIEASADTTRIVCDDFVELELDNGDQGAAILAEAQRIRFDGLL